MISPVKTGNSEVTQPLQWLLITVGVSLGQRSSWEGLSHTLFTNVTGFFYAFWSIYRPEAKFGLCLWTRLDLVLLMWCQWVCILRDLASLVSILYLILTDVRVTGLEYKGEQCAWRDAHLPRVAMARSKGCDTEEAEAQQMKCWVTSEIPWDGCSSHIPAP